MAFTRDAADWRRTTDRLGRRIGYLDVGPRDNRRRLRLRLDQKRTPRVSQSARVNDPDNVVEVSHLEAAIQRHIERCPHATEEDHQYQPDGSEGAIQIRHEPDLVQEEPERYVSIFNESEQTPNPPTTGALHVATNLPNLVVGDYYDDNKDDPREMVIQGAAAGFAVPHDWVQFSNGIPALNQ